MTQPPVLTNPAVLVIDMHKGSTDEPGTVHVPGARSIVPALAGLLDHAREASVPVIHIIHQLRPDGLDGQNPFWMSATNIAELYPNVREQVTGSHWTEPTDGLEPHDGDIVVPKKRYGAFSGNNLAFLLANLGVETLVLTGVETEICVLATAFHAFNEDYGVVVVSDATKGLDDDCAQAALTIIAREVGWVATAAEVADALSAATAPGS